MAACVLCVCVCVYVCVCYIFTFCDAWIQLSVRIINKCSNGHQDKVEKKDKVEIDHKVKKKAR